MKTNRKHCAGCGKRGDEVKLEAGLTAEERRAAKAAVDHQFLVPWKRPDVEKVCRGCSKRLAAAVQQLGQYLERTPARRLTRNSSAEDRAAVATEQQLRAAVQQILEWQPAAPQRSHADVQLAASAAQPSSAAVVQHGDGMDEAEGADAAEADGELAEQQQAGTDMDEGAGAANAAQVAAPPPTPSLDRDHMDELVDNLSELQAPPSPPASPSQANTQLPQPHPLQPAPTQQASTQHTQPHSPQPAPMRPARTRSLSCSPRSLHRSSVPERTRSQSCPPRIDPTLSIQLGFTRTAANSKELQQQHAAVVQPLLAATRSECTPMLPALHALQGAISYAKQQLPQLHERSATAFKKCGFASTAPTPIADHGPPTAAAAAAAAATPPLTEEQPPCPADSSSSSCDSDSGCNGGSSSSETEARPPKRTQAPPSAPTKGKQPRAAMHYGEGSSCEGEAAAAAASKRGRGRSRPRWSRGGGHAIHREGSSSEDVPEASKRGRGRGRSIGSKGAKARGGRVGRGGGGRGKSAPAAPSGREGAQQLHGNARLRLRRVHDTAAKLQAAVQRCEGLVADEAKVAALVSKHQQQQQQQQQQHSEHDWLLSACASVVLTLEDVTNSVRTAATKLLVGRVQDPLHANSNTILTLPTAGLHGSDMHALLLHIQQQFIAAGRAFAAHLGIPSLPCSPPTLAILTCDGGGSQANKDAPPGHPPTTLQQAAQQATAEAAQRAKACRERAGMAPAGKGTQLQQQQLKRELAHEIFTQQPQRGPAAFSPCPENVPLHPAPPGVPFPAHPSQPTETEHAYTSTLSARQQHQHARDRLSILSKLPSMLSHLRPAPHVLALCTRYGNTHLSLCSEAAIHLSQDMPHWSSSTLTTPTTVLRLVNVAMAVGDPSCPAAKLTEVLGQACYERQLCDLQQRGINFATYSIIPLFGQLGSSPACSLPHADNPHKDKRLLCYVRNQKLPPPPPQQQQQLQQLISKEAVLAANVPLINSILQPNADARCVSFKDAFFSMAHLRVELCELGYHTTALVLEIVGRAGMAWDMSGFTHRERLGRLLSLKHMLLTILAPTAASLAQMGKGHVLGVPRDLLWAMLYNVDSFLQFIQRFPVLAEHMVSRFWSHDDVEGVFVSLCFLCGFRPGVEVGLARLVRSEVLAAMRRDPALPFHLPISSKRSYRYLLASRAVAAASFNDGSKLSSAAQLAELDSRASAAAASLAECKHGGIRDTYHKR
ncbi:hypothetical protein DUNSADRAFT_8865 [Dunaliella salina]|uniref:Uncharacterized protein n=1 Tax=Dunaliella salina TaxID=3046 RepID=A0ABQ7H5Q0_DUNSA|nr:hypothetical protein DUNSADRAFT_8865 [Dunaliella salina]|eukprot:KAF5842178.1 hypothetical protein DUNSADRAFT_8865 [Dunaliella salina]